jgi:hypothetical protein
VFLDIANAFDWVWHAGLLHKFRCFGISGKIVEWLEFYLKTDNNESLLMEKRLNGSK